MPEGDFIIIEAPQRCGKTMAMVMWGYEKYLEGRKIFSNIPVEFPHEALQFDEIELKAGQSRFWNGQIMIDELNFYFDARRSLSGRNIKFGTFMLQQKKQGCGLIGTTHDLMSLDLRAREAYDYLITPQVYPAYPKVPERLIFTIENGPMQRPLWRRFAIDCRYLLGMYDTFAVYNPFQED